MRTVCLAALCISALPLLAGTVGHWRFESGGFTDDSSGNGLGLSPQGGSMPYALPVGGGSPGAAFPANVPLSGDANGQASEFDRTNYFSRGDSAAFALQDFTIEAFVHFDQSGLFYTVACQWGGANEYAWRFIRWSNDRLYLTITSDGNLPPELVDSGLTLQESRDYYVAAAVDVGGSGTEVRFYVKDLTADGELQTATVQVSGLGSLYNSSEAFAIGADFHPGHAANEMSGLIDEVRLSDTALDEAELLVSGDGDDERSPSLLILSSRGQGRAMRGKPQCRPSH